MAIDMSGEFWTGENADDLAEYLRRFSADGYPADVVVRAACAACGSLRFRVALDDEEGAATRTCSDCSSVTAMLDSDEYLDDADLSDAECPCGGDTFDVTVGFAMRENAEVRWIYVGLRCLTDGVLGCYADWKIDYEPSRHLLEQV